MPPHKGKHKATKMGFGQPSYIFVFVCAFVYMSHIDGSRDKKR